MTAYFVTAAGTDIGKTYVTAGLVRALRRRGENVGALKPIVSGFDPKAPLGSDPYVLMEAVGLPFTHLDHISPWRYAAPLAPNMAAAREGKVVDTAALENFCRAAVARAPHMFIEGVGGVMAPLADRYTVLDWMGELGLPVVLVGGSYLGSISHTLTALDAISRRRLNVVTVVISESEGSPVSLEETADSIAPFASCSNVRTVRRNADETTFSGLLSALRR